MPERRKLHFDTIDDALAEADRLIAAAKNNQLGYVGKWQLGTIFNHLGVWAEFAYTGLPMKIPFWLPVVVWPFKSQIFKRPMPVGRNIPGIKGGTVGVEDAPLDKALRRFQIAFLRLKNDPPTQPHPIFGKMKHVDWMNLNLRHAELHMSFAVPS